ncbi:hypothetical protein CLOM_g13991 [Closterium sp. NIES-68]|nr:hypothetical protein CLOM_g13991 [Closterium sp. NIES-68]GJP63544.1 hypothetical protein CLOP_g20609 [Closterium sp. NIES-67]
MAWTATCGSASTTLRSSFPTGRRLSAPRERPVTFVPVRLSPLCGTLVGEKREVPVARPARPISPRQLVGASACIAVGRGNGAGELSGVREREREERRAVDRSERLMESPYAPVESSMTPCPVTTLANALLADIVGHFEHFTGLPVVDGEGHCVGIVSEMDVARRQQGARATSAAQVTVGDVMTAPAIVIVQHAPVAYAAGLMQKHKLHRVPVVDDHGVVVGIITRTDIYEPMLPPVNALLHHATGFNPNDFPNF